MQKNSNEKKCNEKRGMREKNEIIEEDRFNMILHYMRRIFYKENPFFLAKNKSVYILYI